MLKEDRERKLEEKAENPKNPLRQLGGSRRSTVHWWGGGGVFVHEKRRNNISGGATKKETKQDKGERGCGDVA